METTQKDTNITSSTLDRLLEEKNAAMTGLFEASSTLKARLRDVASYESRIATYLLESGRTQEAVMQMTSEASLLVNADELIEAVNVYRRCRKINTVERLNPYFEGAIERLEKSISEIKQQKTLKDVIELVQQMGGTMTASADGHGDRWAEFMVENTFFHVDLGTTYHITSPLLDEDIEVTTLDRLKAKIKDVIANRIIARAVEEENESNEEDDWEDDWD